MVYILHSLLLDDEELLHTISKGTASESDKIWSASCVSSKTFAERQLLAKLLLDGRADPDKDFIHYVVLIGIQRGV